MTDISTYAPFIAERQGLIDGTADPVLKAHFKAEIDLVNSWGSGGGSGSSAPPVSPPPLVVHGYAAPVIHTGDAPPPSPPPPSTPPPGTPPPGSSGPSSSNSSAAPDGYATDWHTVRFSNTTGEPITVHVTVAVGEPLPKGVDANGNVSIQPGQYVDLTFPPESRPNFKSTKGDGSVWNQGELYFDEKNHVVWGDMSYIYGANSNMHIFSQDGQHSGYLGDIFVGAPPAAKVGSWGIVAPYDRFHPSDDPNNPGSATGGPNGAKNPGAEYLYGQLAWGEGYVDRGRPAEITDYDDGSSLRFTGGLAVVF